MTLAMALIIAISRSLRVAVLMLPMQIIMLDILWSGWREVALQSESIEIQSNKYTKRIIIL